MGKPVLSGGAKLVGVDIASGRVAKRFVLDAGIRATSFVDDARFNGRHRYLTDAGLPGLIVLDLETGSLHCVLEHHRSVSADRPVSAEGRILRGPDAKPVVIHADQLEVSPDGPTPGCPIQRQGALGDRLALPPFLGPRCPARRPRGVWGNLLPLPRQRSRMIFEARTCPAPPRRPRPPFHSFDGARRAAFRRRTVRRPC